MWHVYVLQSEKSGRHYIGCSNNHKRRLREHNKGENLSTRNGRPWKMIYQESFEEADKAFAREKQIKSYKGGNKFKKLLNL